MGQTLILASGSPRRRALLGELGVPFQVIVSETPKPFDASLDSEAQVIALAKRKARAVAARPDAGFVLGADTIVVLDEALLGKPDDDDDAARILRALSGRSHDVVTGLALVDASVGEEHASAAITTVRFRPLCDDDFAGYVASGEPRDKAGAYAIQRLGRKLVAGFEGCYANVVGLPLCESARLVRSAGLPLRAAAPACRLPDGSPCPRLV